MYGQFHRKCYHRVKKEKKLTYKVCFPMKINKEVLPFDDEVKKFGNNMTSIYLFQKNVGSAFLTDSAGEEQEIYRCSVV